MICYSCNKSYPNQRPEPFWICPGCKKERKDHPPLLSMYWAINPKEQDSMYQLSYQVAKPKQGEK